jgi:hypothetical protein
MRDARRFALVTLLAGLLLGLLLGACGPRPPAPLVAAPAGASPSAPALMPAAFTGWWVAVAGASADDPTAGLEGYLVGPTELAMVVPPKSIERRALQCEGRTPTHWACATGGLPFGLRLHGEALVLEAPDRVVRARRATAAEAQQLEALLATRPNLAAGCARARRCYEAACPLRGMPECDFRRETDGSSLRQCEGTRDGVLVHLQALGKKPPPACR